MTLIEVMVGMVLTSILVFGLSSLWSVVHDQFRMLTLKQKAVLVLHGEMERLAALYTWKNVDDLVDGASAEAGGAITVTGTKRYKKAVGSGSNDLVVNSGFDNGQIFYYDADGSPGLEDRNVVWLDKADNITALLSWSETQQPNNCYGGKCNEITLYLQYPYRYISDSDPLNETAGKVSEMSLKTIVGRRENPPS